MFISITPSFHIITILIINLLQSFAITNNQQFKRHINTLSDWEIGLREATYYALVRERHIRHPHLKEYLYSAPLLGRQDTATPFGDIAIIARGQLYSTPGGFEFVQDPYQNDCDGCHNAPLQCGRVPCDYWAPQDHERLLALWTVKRIRHRDSHYGFRYDFEYKISPMSSINGKPFITRNGNFDYSLEGHKFLVQRDPEGFNLDDSNPYKQVHNPSQYDSDQWTPNYQEPNLNAYLPPLLPPITEDYSDEDSRSQPYGPNGYKDVFYKPERYPTTSPSTPYTKDFNDDLYNNAIGTLTSRFTTPSSTMKTTDEAEFLFPKQKPSSQTKIPFLPTRLTTFKKPTQTRTTKIYYTTNKKTTTPTYFSESTRFVQYSEPDPLYKNTMYTTPPTKFAPTIPQKISKPPTSDTGDSDYNAELFGDYSTSSRSTSTNVTPSTNEYMLFGEQAITVVSPPTISIKDDIFYTTKKPPILDRFGTEQTQTKQKTTQNRFTDQTTSMKSSIKTSVKPTQPTKTTQRKFFITKKPIQVPIFMSTTSFTDVQTTTLLQEILSASTTMTSVFPEENQSTYVTYTSNSINTDETTTTNLSISTDTSPITSTEIKTTNSYETEQYFETSTQETETSRATTTTSPITTRKTKTTVKTTRKPNIVTTNTNSESSAGDDNVFQLNFFGTSPKKPTLTTYTKSPTTSSDVDDIFGGTIKNTESTKFNNTEEHMEKIIFSNFYFPSSMQQLRDASLNSSENVNTPDIQNGTIDPITSQSYITSVSFEVNKKKSTSMQDFEDIKSTGNTVIDNMSVPLRYTDNKQLSATATTKNTKLLDSLTISVLNHANSINYLNNEQIKNSTRSKRNVRINSKKILKEKKRLKIRKRK